MAGPLRFELRSLILETSILSLNYRPVLEGKDGFEPPNKGFADLHFNRTWLLPRIVYIFLYKKLKYLKLKSSPKRAVFLATSTGFEPVIS